MEDEATLQEQPGSAVKNLPMVRVVEDEAAVDAPGGWDPIDGFDFDQVPDKHRMLLIATTNSIRERMKKMAGDSYHFGAQL